MRMRKKRNLEERLLACSGLLLARGKPLVNLKEAAETFRAPVNFEETFKNNNPVRLEVGCGNGGFVAEIARRNPGVNFLALEVCSNVIVTAMEKVKAEGIPNVRFLNVAAEILPCYVKEESVETIYLNFSTPLPQTSREKQRLTSDRFLRIYKTLLKEGGAIEQKTDSRPFFEYSLQKYKENGFSTDEITFDLARSEWAKDNIVTEYESRFLREGKPICRAKAVKRGE